MREIPYKLPCNQHSKGLSCSKENVPQRQCNPLMLARLLHELTAKSGGLSQTRQPLILKRQPDLVIEGKGTVASHRHLRNTHRLGHL